MSDENNMQAVIDAARQGVQGQTFFQNEKVARVYVPQRGAFVDVDLETGLKAPLRKRGKVIVFDAASFNQVLADNKDAGNISIYLDRNPLDPAIAAILNGHGVAGPGWGDMRVEIEFRKTPQWVKWLNIDGKLMTQAAFAEFVEDNMADIADPTGAAMLEIVTLLTATKTTDFRSGVRLSNGQVQFTHSEDIQAKVGAGQVEVPETFKLALAPIFGGPTFGVPARFRYRLSDGKLTMGFKLQRIEDVMQTVFDDVVAKIERGANISVLDGRPPASLAA